MPPKPKPKNPNPLEQFAKMPPGHKVLVVVVLAGALAAGFYFLFLQELLEQIDREKSTKVSIEREIAQINVQLEEKKVLEREIAELRERRERALEKLPAGEEIPSLLQQIHGQAMIVGLDILTFRRENPQPMGIYSAIPVTMQIRGTFHQMVTFFYYVGKMTRIVNLMDIQMSGGTGAAQVMTLTTNVRAVTYMVNTAEAARR